MVRFDDVIERAEKSSSTPDVGRATPPPPPTPEPTVTEPQGSILEWLEEDGPLGGLSDKINPEMLNQVIIPLINVLEKYGYSDSIVGSPTTQNSMAVLGVLTDIAPVIKGLGDYLEGHQTQLAAEDRAFLEELQNKGLDEDLEGLFTNEEGLIEIDQEEEVVIHPILGELPKIDLNEGAINWLEILDPDGTFTGNKAPANTELEDYLQVPSIHERESPRPIINIPTLEDLAGEAGIPLTELKDQERTFYASEVSAPQEALEEEEGDYNPSSFVNSVSLDAPVIDDYLEINKEEE